MNRKLLQIIKDECTALEHLLSLLKKQYEYIMKKDAFSLEEIVDEIKISNKMIAEKEVERRKIVGSNSMKSLIFEAKDKELEDEYKRIKEIIREVQFQKDTNDMIIKQELGFYAQILSIINPRRENKTYTSMGNLSK